MSSSGSASEATVSATQLAVATTTRRTLSWSDIGRAANFDDRDRAGTTWAVIVSSSLALESCTESAAAAYDFGFDINAATGAARAAGFVADFDAGVVVDFVAGSVDNMQVAPDKRVLSQSIPLLANVSHTHSTRPLFHDKSMSAACSRRNTAARRQSIAALAVQFSDLRNSLVCLPPSQRTRILLSAAGAAGTLPGLRKKQTIEIIASIPSGSGCTLSTAASRCVDRSSAHSPTNVLPTSDSSASKPP
mmetsp:Transcript_8535/g.13562  ORF Transcript_8535/g.13562 Transcript_8535/m.13562 type:complete len:248 (-) Transcript_8535:1204-1947(-)